MHARLIQNNIEAKKKKIGMYTENNPKGFRKLLFNFNKEEFYQKRKDSQIKGNQKFFIIF